MATLQDMQSLGYGRKRTSKDTINDLVVGIAQGMKDRRARDMENQKLTIEAGKSGYTPVEKQGGLGGILKGLMSSNAPKYEYTGVAPTALDQAKIADYQAKAAGTGYYDKSTTEKGTTSKDAMSLAKDMAYKLVGGSSMLGMDPSANQQYVQLVNALYNQILSGQQGNLQLPAQPTQQPQQPVGNQQNQNWLGSLIQNMTGGKQTQNRIRVRDKASGQTGTIPANEFDQSKYERI